MFSSPEKKLSCKDIKKNYYAHTKTRGLYKKQNRLMLWAIKNAKTENSCLQIVAIPNTTIPTRSCLFESSFLSFFKREKKKTLGRQVISQSSSSRHLGLSNYAKTLQTRLEPCLEQNCLAWNKTTFILPLPCQKASPLLYGASFKISLENLIFDDKVT